MRADQVSAAFGRVLREQRTAAGVSQEALALSADVDRTFVSQIERGIRQPTLTTLCKLARALDVQPSTLVSKMEKLLRVAREPVDEQKLLQQVDVILELEREVKRAHLSMLVRIRNQLTPDQRAYLIRSAEVPGDDVLDVRPAR